MGDDAGRAHTDAAFLVVSEPAHDGRLNHRHQSHVGVGRNSDGTHQARGEFRGDEDGRRTVGTSDDADSTGLHRGEPEVQSDDVGTEDTELCRCTDEDQFRVGNQGGEVRHSADTQEDERGIEPLQHTEIEIVKYGSILIDTYLQAVGERDVADDDTEADGNQQHRFVLFQNGQGDEERADGNHDDVAQFGVGETRVAPELLDAADKAVHKSAACLQFQQAGQDKTVHKVLYNFMMILFVGVLAEFGQHAAGALRVEEADHEAFRARAGRLVDEAHALLFHFLQCVGGIVHAESHVVDALTALLDEGGDGAFGASGLQKLDFGLSHHEEGGLHLLVGDLFRSVALHAKDVFVIGNCIRQALHGDAKVFNM